MQGDAANTTLAQPRGARYHGAWSVTTVTTGMLVTAVLTSMVVTIGLWLTLAPAVGAIARATKKK